MPRVSDLRFAVASSRGKLELTMTEEEGHEDKLIHRIIDESIKNIFVLHVDIRELRPMVEYFESGQSVEIGDALPSATRPRADRQGPRSSQASRRAGGCDDRGSPDRDFRDAASASAAEFMLEGLHVHNKINKQAKAGGTSYRR